MTSGAITEAAMAFGGLPGNKSNNVSVQKDTKDSFQATMQGITGNSNQTKQQSAMQISQNTKDNKTSGSQDDIKHADTGSTNQKVDRQSSTESKETVQNEKKEAVSETKDAAEAVNETEELDEETKQAIMDATEEMVKNVAEELNVTEEDVKTAMETLGLQLIDILNPDLMNQIVAEISGEDVLTLVTDGDLYTDLQNLTSELADTLQGLTEEIGVTEEELQGMLDDMKETLSKQETPVTEMKPVTPDEMSKQEDVPFLMRDESASIIDFRKNVPEQTGNEKPVQQNGELQNQKVEEKVMTDQPQNSDEKEHTEDHMSQEQTSNHITEYQSMSEDTAAIDETMEEPVFQTADTESILKQLSDYMKTRFSENMTEMEMQLHPASLGTVNLQIASKAGTITAQFSVQNEEVKQAMESQIVQLKENLEQQGVKIEAVEVTVASHSFERNSSEQNQEQNAAYEEEKNKIKPVRRRILNLNDYADLGELTEVEDDAARIAMEMMAGNGNTLDMLA